MSGLNRQCLAAQEFRRLCDKKGLSRIDVEGRLSVWLSANPEAESLKRGLSRALWGRDAKGVSKRLQPVLVEFSREALGIELSEKIFDKPKVFTNYFDMFLQKNDSSELPLRTKGDYIFLRPMVNELKLGTDVPIKDWEEFPLSISENGAGAPFSFELSLDDKNYETCVGHVVCVAGHLHFFGFEKKHLKEAIMIILSPFEGDHDSHVLTGAQFMRVGDSTGSERLVGRLAAAYWAQDRAAEKKARTWLQSKIALSQTGFILALDRPVLRRT